MTPKEKALQLANKFYEGPVFGISSRELKEQKEKAKQRALICATEFAELNLATQEFWEEVIDRITDL